MLEALAGKRSGQIVAATLSNFESVEKALTNMQNSAGNADAEMEVIMGSLEYKLNALRETGTGIAQNLFNRGDIGMVVTSLTKVLEVIEKITSKLGLFGMLGTIFGGGMLISGIRSFSKAWSTLSGKSGWDNLTNGSKILSTISNAFPKLSSRIDAFGEAYRKATDGGANGFTSMLSGINAFTGGILPAVAAVAALSTALILFNDATHGYTNAMAESKTASSDYSNAKSDLENLTSEYEEQKQKIAELNELKQNGSITLQQEVELSNLEKQNKALEIQLRTQENLAKLKGAKAASAAVTAATTEKSYVEDQQEKYGKVGGFFSGLAGYATYTDPLTGQIYNQSEEYKSKDTTELGITRENISLLDEYEKELEKVNKQLSTDPTNKGLISRQKELTDNIIPNTKGAIADSQSAIQGWIDSITDLDGNPLQGYEEYYREFKDILMEISNIGLSDQEKALNELNSFFDGSSTSNAIKDRLAKANDSGKDLEKTLGNLGLSLSDLGADVDSQTLVRYFNEITSAAEEAEEATAKVNNNITVEDANTALADNKKNGSNFTKRHDSMKEAEELAEQGLYNNAAFKTFTESITYGLDDSKKGYEKAMKRLKKYYTTVGDEYEPILEKQQEELKVIEASLAADKKNEELKAQKKAKQAEIKETKSKISSDGKDFTTDGMTNLLTDLNKLDKRYASVDEKTGKWKVNIDNTAKAAKGLKISTADLETLLARLQEYDIADSFTFDSQVDKLAEAQDALSGLKSYWMSMEDGKAKDLLGANIENWEKDIDKANEDLSTLPDTVVTELQFTYDREQLRNLADNAMQQAEMGGWNNTADNAAAIITAQNYRNKLASGLDLNSVKTEVPVYFNAQSAINDLKAQLKSGQLDEETTMKVQMQIANLTTMQSELLEAFANAPPEITPETDPSKANKTFLDWVKSAEGQSVVTKLGLETNDVLNQISELTSKDVGEMKVPISIEGYDEFESMVSNIENTKLSDKISKIIAEDEASGVIALYNQLSADDKFATLSADDQASQVISIWNALLPEEKQAILTGEITVTDNASAPAANAESAVEAIPTQTNSNLTATDGVSGVAASASRQLSILNGKTAHTYIITHEQTRKETKLSGTANLSGTAFSSGSNHESGVLNDTSWLKSKWKTKKTETALTGEEGRELVATKSGYWYTIGDSGAEFNTIPSGSVVFNARQTKELLSKGHINGRGKHIGGSLLSGTSEFYPNFISEAKALDGVSKLSGTAYASGSGGSSKNSDKEFDFVEIKLNRIEETIKRVKIATESAYNTLTKRNKSATTEIDLLTQQIDLQNKAYKRYMQEANNSGLSSDWQAKVKEGSIDISKITDETLSEQISDFQKYYEKAIKAKDAVAELHQEVAKLYSSKFNNIASDFENQLDLIEHLTKTYKTGIEKLEAEGLMGSKKYYEYLQAAEKQNQETLTEELSKLTTAFSEAMDSGEISENSEQWYDFQKKINGVKEALDESTVSMLEYQKSLRELEWDFFDFAEDRISNINDEAKFLIDLMAKSKLYEENGEMTDTGKASVALRGQNYNVLMAQADQYGNEASNISSLLADDPYNTDLIKRREELLKLQREAILDAESEKDAIKDLIKDGYDKQIDSLKELSTKYIESLDSAKSLYEYQKNIKNQTSEISKLQKQLSAYKNDSSQETRATVQKIEVSLKEAMEQLQETEYDQYLTEQKKLLDQLSTDYETYMNTRLDDTNNLISETIIAINESNASVMETLKTESANVGYSMSDALNTIWSNEGGASQIVTKYGDNFLAQFTSVNQALATVSNYVAGLQAKADAEAKAKEAKTKKTTAKTTPSKSANTKTTSSKTSSKGGNSKFNDDVKKGVAAAIWVYGGSGSGWGNDPERSKKLTAKFGATNAKAVQDYLNTRANSGELYNYWIGKGRNLSSYYYNKFATGLRKSNKEQDAWVNEFGNESIVSPTKRAIITHISKGDSVLDAEATKNIWQMANDPSAFISSRMTRNGSSFGSAVNSETVYNMDNININMPGVKNYEETVNALRRDPQFENMVQAMTTGRSKKGSSKLDKYKY